MEHQKRSDSMIKYNIVLFAISMAFLISGCGIKPNHEAWRSIFSGDRDKLKGVIVQQNPDSGEDMYIGKHPCMVIYIFSDNKAYQVEFTPDGFVDSIHWYQAESYMLDKMVRVNGGASLNNLIIEPTKGPADI